MPARVAAEKHVVRLLIGLSPVPAVLCSYSAYEVLFGSGKDLKLQNLTAAFDYIAQRLPEKPGVPGPRVFLGEW